MRVKIIVTLIALSGIIFFVVFGSTVKEMAVKNILKDIPEYRCEDDFCTSCMIEGDSCSCGKTTCDCGNRTVDRKQCSLS